MFAISKLMRVVGIICSKKVFEGDEVSALISDDRDQRTSVSKPHDSGMVSKFWEGNEVTQVFGGPPKEEIERLVEPMASENPSWSYAN